MPCLDACFVLESNPSKRCEGLKRILFGKLLFAKFYEMKKMWKLPILWTLYQIDWCYILNIQWSCRNIRGHWLWLSCQRGCFWNQRFAVQIQSSAKFIMSIFYCQLYWKNENRQKEAGNGTLNKEMHIPST